MTRDTPTTAVLSLLHEPAGENAATRQFRGRPVLAWTLDRLRRCRASLRVVVTCWADQADPVRAAGGEPLTAGERRPTPSLVAVAAARRWADGWRGGLISSTEFDLGFDGRTTSDLGTCVLLIDASAAFVDPALVDQVIARGLEGDNEFAFAPAAPGFAAMFLSPAVAQRLAEAKASPGVLLTYQPDAPMRDPLGSPGCVAPPLAVARSSRRYKLDSRYQAARFERLFDGRTDGDLLALPAEEIVRLDAFSPVDPLPRDVTVELTTRRQCRPIYSLLSRCEIARPDLSRATAGKLMRELADRDDVRLTFAGVGDPVLHGAFAQIVADARAAGVGAIHVETDLLADAASVDALADLPIDVVSVHLPALTGPTYQRVMGEDRLADAMANVQRFVARRAARGRRTPVLAPTFVKTRHNLAEMEPWYDAWIRAVGSAVVTYPTDHAGTLAGEDASVGDMSPPQRVPCRRLASRMTVLCDGTVVSCEEDLSARRPMGRAGERPIREIWHEAFGELRAAHADRRWNQCGACADCREWNRP